MSKNETDKTKQNQTKPLLNTNFFLNMVFFWFIFLINRKHFPNQENSQKQKQKCKLT